MCTIEEAKDFLEKVPAEQNYMATSCCPAWHSMIEKLYPSEMGKISMTLTPMVFTARLIKKYFPGCRHYLAVDAMVESFILFPSPMETLLSL